MDAVTAIMNDHRRLERLFGALRVGDGDPAEVMAEVKARLLAHSHAEEEHVYPAIVHEDPGEKKQVHHGVHEHREAEEAQAKAERALGTANFTKACSDFIHMVNHHVEEEESEILPALRDETPAGELDRLGAKFEERRTAELADAGYGPELRDGRSGGYADENTTKDELYNKARRAGVQGRSDMNKDELKRAVEETRK